MVVGMQCSGSDAFSSVTTNPAVGYDSDLLVRYGATADVLRKSLKYATPFIC